MFKIFHLEFLPFWVFKPFDLGDLSNLGRDSGNFFKSYIFEISAFQGKKMRHVLVFSSKFSLNLSTEEVWFVIFS